MKFEDVIIYIKIYVVSYFFVLYRWNFISGHEMSFDLQIIQMTFHYTLKIFIYKIDNPYNNNHVMYRKSICRYKSDEKMHLG